MGTITLPVTVGQGTHMVTTMTDFLVFKALSFHNANLGRPILNDLKMVTSTYHLKMKFPTQTRIGKVRGEQILARKCYVQELKAKAPAIYLVQPPPPPPLVWEGQHIKARDESNLMQAGANEPLEIVKLHSKCPNNTMRVGTRLPLEYQEVLKQLLIEHKDIFA